MRTRLHHCLSFDASLSLSLFASLSLGFKKETERHRKRGKDPASQTSASHACHHLSTLACQGLSSLSQRKSLSVPRSTPPCFLLLLLLLTSSSLPLTLSPPFLLQTIICLQSFPFSFASSLVRSSLSLAPTLDCRSCLAVRRVITGQRFLLLLSDSSHESRDRALTPAVHERHIQRYSYSFPFDGDRETAAAAAAVDAEAGHTHTQTH